MAVDFGQVYADIGAWAVDHGIRVTERRLEPNTAGEFDGVSATMNSDYAADERAHYLVHALGSMVRWSLSRATVQQMFEELRGAKKEKHADPDRLERAIERYRAFETESSEFAVWLLGRLGHGAAIAAYTNFMRADLEALTQFHRSGATPVWCEFFARWNERMKERGSVPEPFHPKPIPAFQATRIECQSILQEQPKPEN